MPTSAGPRTRYRLLAWLCRWRKADERELLLQVIQPGLVGLIDGTISTLAPIFAAAYLSGSHDALFVGLATALGAGISMALSEGLSDTGEETGRGSAFARAAIIGTMTFVGGSLHSLPFLIGNVHTALAVAYGVVAVELSVIAAIRKRFLHVPLRLSIVQVLLGGILVTGVGFALGHT
jgi:VIT1/CCC1 family predicted Fe2+/Mn2+ transporter